MISRFYVLRFTSIPFACFSFVYWFWLSVIIVVSVEVYERKEKKLYYLRWRRTMDLEALPVAWRRGDGDDEASLLEHLVFRILSFMGFVMTTFLKTLTPWFSLLLICLLLLLPSLLFHFFSSLLYAWVLSCLDDIGMILNMVYWCWLLAQWWGYSEGFGLLFRGLKF